MFLNNVADLAELIRFGVAVDGLDIHGLGDSRMFKPVVAAGGAVVDKAEGLQQGGEVAEGEVVVALTGQQLGLQLIRLVHWRECIRLYAGGQGKNYNNGGDGGAAGAAFGVIRPKM